ncbi:nitric oxide synthase [Fusarium pseudocircinatum]|uniref:nitric-oxide synthase (NADPH) n=1 Tax=Fusarium pseudocircinatum TaxID=56676 RepID=A0A8H5LFH9_9HYPO|nr:nitric oxide synthase [Fusarium pseudocircinatum]
MIQFDSKQGEEMDLNSKLAASRAEFGRIREAHGILATTGCTTDFCQAGRMIHTDEPRVGTDRPVSIIKQEATDFLSHMWRAGLISDLSTLHLRLDHAFKEIDSHAAKPNKDNAERPGSPWHQSTQELEFGLKAAWKNSRRCIMRSEYDNLVPFITAIPDHLFPLVKLRHPRWPHFEYLGLRWVPAPALSRLGFDIGGVQYTAAPFVGWFMDAEIGVRNLADTNRYNCLPQVACNFGWITSDQNIDDIPKAEQLHILTRAQTELNYAVYHSFKADRVRIVDTLSASHQFCRFDDQHLQENGFRLPSDPYWLAPPQGSIVPIWHRGASPSYQPKPMICRNFRDPMKAWEKSQTSDIASESKATSNSIDNRKDTGHGNSNGKQKSHPSLLVHHCGSGNVAMLLAKKLLAYSRNHIARALNLDLFPATQSLDLLNVESLRPGDVVLLVVSTSGRGQVPKNGEKFVSQLASLAERGQSIQGRFALFGNGDSSYGHTFNNAADTIHCKLKSVNANFVLDNYFPGDAVDETPPWTQLRQWWDMLQQQLTNRGTSDPKPFSKEHVKLVDPLKLERIFPVHAKVTGLDLGRDRIRKVTLELNQSHEKPMQELLILVPNSMEKVNRVIKALHLSKKKVVNKDTNLTYFEFLRDFVDLDAPFANLAWTKDLGLSDEILKEMLVKPVVDTVSRLPHSAIKRMDGQLACLSAKIQRPRVYTIASFDDITSIDKNHSLADLLVGWIPGGRFSDVYLNSQLKHHTFRCRVLPLPEKFQQLAEDTNVPIILFATGSGVAMIRSLLQFHIYLRKRRLAHSCSQAANISIFVGYRPIDTEVILDSVATAANFGIVDMLSLMPSNEEKVRAQDKVFSQEFTDRVVVKIKNGCKVLACGGRKSVGGFGERLDALVYVEGITDQ